MQSLDSEIDAMRAVEDGVRARLDGMKSKEKAEARPALFPRPIPPSFPVLARAFLWCLVLECGVLTSRGA